MAANAKVASGWNLDGLRPGFNQVRMYRLVERNRDRDEVGFTVFALSDSRRLHAGTAPIKKLAMTVS